MEAIDFELAHAVGGGTTLDNFLAALARNESIERIATVTSRRGEVFD